MGGTHNQASGPDFSRGVSTASLPDGAQLHGHVAGEPVLLVRRGDEIFALSSTCTHYGGPLHEGLITGESIHCPWHHACFSLRTGAASAPALNPVACWNVERDGDRLFVREKRTPPAAPAVTGPSSVVIVGGGAAGHAAAEALRGAGYKNPVTLLSAESSGPVDRPNLSKDFLAGQAPLEWIPLRPPEFFAENNLQLRTGVTVAEIRPQENAVMLANGERIGYGALLLATGASPVKLPLPGADSPHVYYLRTLDDSNRIIAAAEKARRAVVIGGSFIGLEVAASLRTRGLEVAVVAPETTPLERVLGEQVGRAIQRLHESHGVVFHLGHKPAAIGQAAVTLDDGQTLPCDLVVIGVGVRPNTELAEKAGLKVDRGVVVDAFLETSYPGIYAAGDIARWPAQPAGELVRVEHWVHAQRQGERAARNILGQKQPFRDVPFFWSAHYDRTIRYTGIGAGFTDVKIDGSPQADAWTATYLKDGRIVAVATLNRDRANLEAEAALANDDQAALRDIAAGKVSS